MPAQRRLSWIESGLIRARRLGNRYRRGPRMDAVLLESKRPGTTIVIVDDEVQMCALLHTILAAYFDAAHGWVWRDGRSPRRPGHELLPGDFHHGPSGVYGKVASVPPWCPRLRCQALHTGKAPQEGRKGLGPCRNKLDLSIVLSSARRARPCYREASSGIRFEADQRLEAQASPSPFRRRGSRGSDWPVAELIASWHRPLDTPHGHHGQCVDSYPFIRRSDSRPRWLLIRSGRGQRQRDEPRRPATAARLVRLPLVPSMQGALRRRGSEGTARLASNSERSVSRVQGRSAHGSSP